MKVHLKAQWFGRVVCVRLKKICAKKQCKTSENTWKKRKGKFENKYRKSASQPFFWLHSPSLATITSEGPMTLFVIYWIGIFFKYIIYSDLYNLQFKAETNILELGIARKNYIRYEWSSLHSFSGLGITLLKFGFLISVFFKTMGMLILQKKKKNPVV